MIALEVADTIVSLVVEDATNILPVVWFGIKGEDEVNVLLESKEDPFGEKLVLLGDEADEAVEVVVVSRPTEVAALLGVKMLNVDVAKGRALVEFKAVVVGDAMLLVEEDEELTGVVLLRAHTT